MCKIKFFKKNKPLARAWLVTDVSQKFTTKCPKKFFSRKSLGDRRIICFYSFFKGDQALPKTLDLIKVFTMHV